MSCGRLAPHISFDWLNLRSELFPFAKFDMFLQSLRNMNDNPMRKKNRYPLSKIRDFSEPHRAKLSMNRSSFLNLTEPQTMQSSPDEEIKQLHVRGRRGRMSDENLQSSIWRHYILPPRKGKFEAKSEANHGSHKLGPLVIEAQPTQIREFETEGKKNFSARLIWKRASEYYLRPQRDVESFT
jgi:hypothetical protein